MTVTVSFHEGPQCTGNCPPCPSCLLRELLLWLLPFFLRQIIWESGSHGWALGVRKSETHGGRGRGALMPRTPELEGFGHGEASRPNSDFGGLFRPGWEWRTGLDRGCHELTVPNSKWLLRNELSNGRTFTKIKHVISIKEVSMLQRVSEVHTACPSHDAMLLEINAKG